MGKLNKISRRTGFTLIELLGVIFIISLLMALAFPILKTVQDRARRTKAYQQAQQASRSWSAYLLEETSWPEDGAVSGSEAVSMTPEVCAILNRDNVYLELNEEEKKIGYLDPWGLIAYRNEAENYEDWLVRVAFDDDYDGHCEYEGPDGKIEVRQSVIAWSVGPDGISGTEDDIVTWRMKRDE